MDEALKVPYPYDGIKVRPLVAVEKRGFWRLANPTGVECPFCDHWQHLPTSTCPECAAILIFKRR